MVRRTGFAIAILLLALGSAHADDGHGLKRGGDAGDVSISGVSSGAAMAVQYAVAHSGTITGVGSIAGPGWGCAEGKVSRAINICMCGRDDITPEYNFARIFAASNAQNIDPLIDGKPRALKRSYVFQSAADATVVEKSGQAGAAFLNAFIGHAPVVDQGNPGDDSNHAGHGIVSPDGTDSCRANGNDRTYVRHCGADDTAGKLFLALFGDGKPYDASKRVEHIPESEVWEFDQQRIVDAVKKKASTISADSFYWFFPAESDRRENLDLARNGYIYVPPPCRQADSKCRVHIALHGCKQDAKNFALTAGYNNWAEYYKTIVVYPAVQQPAQPGPEGICQSDPIPRAFDSSPVEPNPNGCWDWWGYLDPGWPETYRYLTKKAPQMQVIERIIAEVTAPRP